MGWDEGRSRKEREKGVCMVQSWWCLLYVHVCTCMYVTRSAELTRLIDGIGSSRGEQGVECLGLGLGLGAWTPGMGCKLRAEYTRIYGIYSGNKQ